MRGSGPPTGSARREARDADRPAFPGIERDDVDELREARIAAARHNPRWTEIPDDLVPRGRCLVSAATDEVLPHRGVVFERGSARLVADMAPLVFTVTADGELRFLDRQPGSWSDVVAEQARRERAAK